MRSAGSLHEGSEPILKLEGVSKSFGGIRALVELDLSVWEGETLGLIGPNGAGKSTVFNVITSLYRPDKGRVYILGRDITGAPPHKVCRMGISRTYQLTRVFLKLTTLENVVLASVYGSGRRRRGIGSRAVAMEVLEMLGLDQRKDEPAAHLTLSDRRCLEIAMALASEPRVLLLDEPMAGLTPVEIERLVGIIERVVEEKRVGIVWIEHKVDALLACCDRVVVLDHGTKIAEGEPDVIVNDPRVIEVYLGEADT